MKSNIFQKIKSELFPVFWGGVFFLQQQQQTNNKQTTQYHTKKQQQTKKQTTSYNNFKNNIFVHVFLLIMEPTLDKNNNNGNKIQNKSNNNVSAFGVISHMAEHASSSQRIYFEDEVRANKKIKKSESCMYGVSFFRKRRQCCFGG